MPKICQKQPKNHPTSRKIPQIIYIYLYFYGLALASSRRDLDATWTRAGKPGPKNTHARTDAKHLLDGRRPENAIAGLWRPPEIIRCRVGAKGDNNKKVSLF